MYICFLFLARALAAGSSDVPKTTEDYQQEIATCKNRSKRLLELRKNALAIGDTDTASSLKEQADQLKSEIKVMEDIIGVKRTKFGIAKKLFRQKK